MHRAHGLDKPVPPPGVILTTYKSAPLILGFRRRTSYDAGGSGELILADDPDVPLFLPLPFELCLDSCNARLPGMK